MRKRAEAPPIVCHACRLQVLGRGGDLEGWKAVQMDPAQAELRWFCMKPICQHAYALALQEAQVVWAGGIPEPEQPMIEEDQVQLHQQVQEHLQRQEEGAQSEPREPPPMLSAYETSNVEEAGFKDEPFPYYRFEGQEEPQELPEEPLPDPPRRERYVPQGSPPAESKFIRHKGTGKDE